MYHFHTYKGLFLLAILRVDHRNPFSVDKRILLAVSLHFTNLVEYNFYIIIHLMYPYRSCPVVYKSKKKIRIPTYCTSYLIKLLFLHYITKKTYSQNIVKVLHRYCTIIVALFNLALLNR